MQSIVRRTAVRTVRRFRRTVADDRPPVDDAGRHQSRVMVYDRSVLDLAPARRVFSRADYHAMGAAGILAPDERVELMEGEVVAMAPIGSRHAACVLLLNRVFSTSSRLAGRTLVQVQNPLAASDRSETQPDLMLLAPRDDAYAAAHPGPQDVLLLVEVADSSLQYDRRAKIPFYAEIGVREVWLIDLVHDRLEAHTQPAPDGYRVTRRFEPGESVEPSAFPGLRVEAARIIPPARPPEA